MRQLREWTTKEIQYLKNNCADLSLESMASCLNRTPKSVKCQANRLGIETMTESYMKLYKQEYMFYIGDDIICSGTIKEIADTMNTTFKAVSKYRHKSYENRLNRRLVEI